ncbi:MAG: DUF167 domain-containing protein [Chloroflexota bacterium]
MGIDEGTTILIHVQPNSSRNEIIGFQDDVLRVRIAAPPVKGKANQELIKFLSDILGVSKSSLAIKKGLTGKNKVVKIDGLTPAQITTQVEKSSQNK